MATANRIEGIGGGTGRGGGGGGRLSAPPKGPKVPKEKDPAISVRSKSVDTGTKRMVTKQNKAAESYKIKDLDKYEKGKAQRAAAKKAAEAAAKKQSNKDKAKGAVAATAGIAAGMTIVSAPKAKAATKPTPKATAKAKPMTEAQKQAKAMDKLMAKRKAVSKKTGSWPNYNTN